jgi:hippurate hydrolase
MDKVKGIVNDRFFAWIVENRRKIHQWPEKAFEEYKTAELVAQNLKTMGIDYETGVAKTGVVGRLITDKTAPTVALRADMDAIPVSENTGLSFASQNPGLMHACGHDGHVAILLGAARLLKERPPSGNVIFIFQPGEEGQGGAQPMIEEGVLDGVDVIFGGHLERFYRVGEIGIKKGIHTSYTDAFEINIIGKGGHAARPHESIDAVVIASQMVNYLQTIVSRELDPLHPSVLSIGMLHAGTVYNAIAEKAVLKGTVRTTEESVRHQIVSKIKGIASSLATLYAAKIDVSVTSGYPPVVNHSRECGFAEEVAENLLGKEKVISIPLPSLGGEDFAYYTQHIPGCFVRFGAAKKGCEHITSHSPRFDFDEEAMRIGAAFMSEIARHAINKLRKKSDTPGETPDNNSHVYPKHEKHKGGMPHKHNKPHK